MLGIFNLIRELITDEVERGIKNAVAPVGPWLRKLSTGVLLISLSAWAFALCLLFATTALFLSLAQQPQYALAAIITSLPCFVLALMLVMLGVSRIKKPR